MNGVLMGANFVVIWIKLLIKIFMKIKNIFKKSEKIIVKSTVQKLQKNQLEKVVGGAETVRDTTRVKALDANPTL